VRLVGDRTEHLSDASLLAGVAANDREACVAFIERFKRTVYGLAMSMLGDREVAQDVAQETFSRAWRHAHAYDPRRGALASWLLGITRNLAIDMLRMRRAEPIDPHDLNSLGMLSTDTDPCDVAVHASDGRRVRAAVALLPTEQRRALVLSVFQGCTAQEISRLEQIPLGTAKTRIRAGLQKVRALLDDEVDLSD
jgi:RNA polymerase sigma-70 factor (ECF subfamily)